MGKRQGELTSEYIYNHFEVSKIFSSDLSRCVETIKPLAKKLSLDIITDSGLREISVGDWQGRFISDIEIESPNEYKVWKENIGIAYFPGGESYAECQKRIVKTMDGILKSELGKTVVIATHGGVLRA